MAKKRGKTNVTNIVLAALVIATVAISLVGTMMVQSISYKQGSPLGTGEVRVNVAQAPSNGAAQVTVNIVAREG